jgi:mono/diheme cytochrome c family protein
MIMKKIFVAILLATLAIGWTGAGVSAQEQGSMSPAEQKRLFREGARLWPVYCNTCHNARPGSEKAPYEWDQIIMHMRSVANLPEEDAEAIKVFLKAR